MPEARPVAAVRADTQRRQEMTSTGSAAKTRKQGFSRHDSDWRDSDWFRLARGMSEAERAARYIATLPVLPPWAPLLIRSVA